MKRSIIVLLLVLIPHALPAQTPATPDPKLDTLAQDLRALARVVALAQDLERNRQVLLAITDADIESLRMAREDGTYRWASLQREEASRVKDEKTIEQVSTEKELRYVTVTATNAYRVDVTVPKKRSMLAENNRVYIRNVLVDTTGFDGKITHNEMPVMAWVNPGDTNSVALPEIGKSVKATVELGVESGNKKAVAEVSLVQAKLVDDPLSPYFPAVKRLLQIRDLESGDINRGHLKNAIDEALLALPGELERRAEEQQRMADSRTTAKGSIAPGDATPDVVNALSEIARLMNGNAADQTAARTKLGELVGMLSPRP
jgi:hypothetical protein